MCKKDGSANPGTHFSEIWANAQIVRTMILSALVRKAWRQLFGGAAHDDDRPVKNARRLVGA